MRNKRHLKRKIHYGRVVICLVISVVVGSGILYGVQQYNNPTIFGKWQSEETNYSVDFNENGTVVLEKSEYNPTFAIISPNKMNYTIDEKVFEMYYHIDGRTLYWGQTEDTLETFKRK